MIHETILFATACIFGFAWYRRYSQRAAMRAYASYFRWIKDGKTQPSTD